MAASKTIGGINVTISATIDKFQKDMVAARKSLSTFTKSISSTIFSMKGLATAMTGGAIATFTKHSINQIAALSELSVKLGIGTESLAGFQLAAEEAGVNSGTFEKAILRMTKGISDAHAGIGKAAKGFDQFGINVETLIGLAPDKQFAAIADSINRLAGDNEKLNATMAIFGTRGSDMVRLIKGGSAAMNEAQDAAKRMGLAIGDDIAAGVEKANDQLGRFKKQLEGLGWKAAVAVTPAIKAVNETLEGWSMKKMRSQGGRGSLPYLHDYTGPDNTSLVNETDPFKLFIRKGRSDAEVLAFRARQMMGSIGSPMGWIGKAGSGLNSLDALFKRANENKKSVGSAFDSPLVSGIAKSLAWRLGGNAAILGGKALGAIGGGINAFPGAILKAQIMGQMYQANNWQGAAAMAGNRSPLTLAQSGSADSYRQQAAIRRQGEDIQKKQLGVQQKMAVALNSIDRKTVATRDSGIA